MNLDNQLTIIIPTHNARYKKLVRLLNYYKSYEFPANIQILMASDDDNILTDLKYFLSHNNINYKQFPSSIHFNKKLEIGFNEVDTPYSVICADDDFITPNGLIKSVEFLNDNLDYSTAHGKYIFYYLDEEKQFQWSTIYDKGQTIDLEDPHRRLSLFISQYVLQTFYAVHRTNEQKLFLEKAVNYTSDMRFPELLLGALGIISGKMKVLNTLYCAREYNRCSDGHTAKKITDFISEGTYKKKYIKFKDCLIDALSSNRSFSTAELNKLIDDAMTEYLRRFEITELHLVKLKLDSSMKKILGQKLSKYLKSKLFRKPLIQFDKPLNPNFNDFRRIKQIVKSYH